MRPAVDMDIVIWVLFCRCAEEQIVVCCRHYCFPGAPQVWLYHAFLAILKAPWSPLPAP